MHMARYAPIAFALWALAVGAEAATPAPSAALLSPAQHEVDRISIDVFNGAAVRAKRREIVKAWSALPPYQSADGKSQLQGAVDELVYFAVRAAVERTQPVPAILWYEAPPYRSGRLNVPGSRMGVDLPDRIYRFSAVDPESRYVIRGKRDAFPSNDDFIFEASDHQVAQLSALPAKDIDVAPDGSFTITLDATPAAGRRNHLTLPPQTTDLMVRDTLADWDSQRANALSIERVAGPPRAKPSMARVRQEALSQIDTLARFNVELMQRAALHPANQIVPFLRSARDGVQGAIGSMARFSLKDDEALVIVVDPQGNGYTNLQLTDPWLRSVPYWNDLSSLSDRQAKPNPDGTITFIVAPRDPGYFNWVSTGGLHDGGMTLRIERVARVDPATVIRQAKVVKLSDLASVLPAGAVRITPAERAAQLKARAAGYARRLGR